MKLRRDTSIGLDRNREHITDAALDLNEAQRGCTVSGLLLLLGYQLELIRHTAQRWQ